MSTIENSEIFDTCCILITLKSDFIANSILWGTSFLKQKLSMRYYIPIYIYIHLINNF